MHGEYERDSCLLLYRTRDVAEPACMQMDNVGLPRSCQFHSRTDRVVRGYVEECDAVRIHGYRRFCAHALPLGNRLSVGALACDLIENEHAAYQQDRHLEAFARGRVGESSD